MIVTLAAALSLAASLAMEVPYLAQTDALCGGAAAAMVFRYWGDVHADPQEFASIVDRRAGGIANGALVDGVRRRGWQAVELAGGSADPSPPAARGPAARPNERPPTVRSRSPAEVRMASQMGSASRRRSRKCHR